MRDRFDDDAADTRSNRQDPRGASRDAAGHRDPISNIVLGPDTLATGYGFGEREAELQVFVDTQTVDADLAPGPYVPVGSPVRWTYTVVNNGDTSISGILVTDSETGAVGCPSTTLAPDATMDCVVDGVAVAGQYENTATVTGSVDASEVGTGGAGLFEVVEVQGSDLSHYFGMLTGVAVTVTVNDEDASSAPGPVVPNGGNAQVLVALLLLLGAALVIVRHDLRRKSVD